MENPELEKAINEYNKAKNSYEITRAELVILQKRLETSRNKLKELMENTSMVNGVLYQGGVYTWNKHGILSIKKLDFVTLNQTETQKGESDSQQY